MPYEEIDKRESPKTENLMTFHQYLSYDYSPQTITSYKRAVNHFLFHSDRGEQSTYADVIEYLYYHDFQSQRVISALKQYFDYLIHTGKRTNHPCKGLVMKRKPKPLQFQELFTPEELETLLNRPVRYGVLEDRNKAIISLLIYQGLTPQNIENLKTGDINIDEGKVHIKGTRTVRKRTLELKPKQVILIYRYVHSSRKKLIRERTDALFIAKLGEPICVDTINRMLRPLKRLFPAKNLNAGTIRQSVICNWLNEQKIPLEDVQLLSGQKWMSTTEKYIKPNTDEKRELINQFFPL